MLVLDKSKVNPSFLFYFLFYSSSFVSCYVDQYVPQCHKQPDKCLALNSFKYAYPPNTSHPRVAELQEKVINLIRDSW